MEKQDINNVGTKNIAINNVVFKVDTMFPRNISEQLKLELFGMGCSDISVSDNNAFSC